MSDHWRTLGVSPGATQDEIKGAFRKLALQHHPDRHAGASAAQQEQAAARFKAITEAYDVLTDDRKRSQYEASHRSGGYARGGGGGAGAGYGRGSSYGQTYGSRAGVNTDWAKSEYTHGGDYGRVRISWFQELQRAVGRRKLEAGFGLAAVGLLLFGGAAVDAMWSTRNKGKSFSEFQSARAASTAAAAVGAGAGGQAGQQGGAAEAAAAEPLGRPKPYTPAVGCTSRHSRSMVQQRGGGGQSLFPSAQERQLAELPLAELIAAEERACAAEQEERERAERGRVGERERQGGRGGDAGGAGKAGGGGSGAAVVASSARPSVSYVDRAVIIPPPSPPGQMAGHRAPPPVAPAATAAAAPGA
ncbi:hypothetical protein HYH02_003571 [Chlamydomonas schloesseri]|uniref:J domain-containing protein n=1 Tax=Chlamydomonas schloesseri TaxID=2026947 RepID=A0A835WQF5_9CHLO|nr:hypothetical protein HYH02_003571 [Chlamydomonas schloesseri]|eukprot:KAG2451795.1 hypothetical protein HYH02_003571 [Chlamydomonas schloesseri]